jgi:hypothetical protein
MNLTALKGISEGIPRRYQLLLNNFGRCALLQAVRSAKPQNHPRSAGAEHSGPVSGNCWATEYQRRMRRFNVAVVLAALISLVFLITYSVIGWSYFLS